MGNNAQRESHQDVAAPRVQAPMVKGDKESLLRKLVVVLPGRLEKRISIAPVVEDGFRHAVLVES